LQRLFYHPTDIKPDPKLTKHLRYTTTKLYEAGLEFEAVDPDFSKKSLLDIDFANHKCLEDYLCLNLSWLFSCLSCLKSFGCFKSVQCILKVLVFVIDDQTEALFRNLMPWSSFIIHLTHTSVIMFCYWIILSPLQQMMCVCLLKKM